MMRSRLWLRGSWRRSGDSGIWPAGKWTPSCFPTGNPTCCEAQAKLRQSDAERRESAAILDARAAYVALLDRVGNILSVNEGWRSFARAEGLHDPAVGVNYLEVCDQAHGLWSDGASDVASGIRRGNAGLVREAIPLAARIVCVADTFDATLSDRPYRAGLSRSRAIEEIRNGSGSQFDPQVVGAFLSVMAQSVS